MENHIDAYLLVRTTFHGRCSASADKPIQQCTALAVEEHKVFISETDGTKGFFRGIMSASA